MTYQSPSLKAKRRNRRGKPAPISTGVRVRPMVKPSRKAYFQLYAPKWTWDRLKNAGTWRPPRLKLAAAGLVVALAALLYLLFTDSFFFVDTVNVQGNRFVSAEEIVRTTGVRGWSVFFLDPNDVQAAIMKMPIIKNASVTVDLPNTVNIQIVERTPRFIWETRGTTFWVDEEGIAFPARANLSGLMWLKDADAGEVKAGRRINPVAFNAAATLHNLWPSGPAVFEWSQAHGLAVREEHNWVVYFGDDSQMPDKLAALRVVQEQLVRDKKSVSFIDLGSGLPYYREVTTAVPVKK